MKADLFAGVDGAKARKPEKVSGKAPTRDASEGSGGGERGLHAVKSSKFESF